MCPYVLICDKFDAVVLCLKTNVFDHIMTFERMWRVLIVAKIYGRDMIALKVDRRTQCSKHNIVGRIITTKIKKKVGDKDGERSARRGAWGCVGDDVFSHMQTINGGRVHVNIENLRKNGVKVIV